ncbi:hypothetical protein A2264_02545 [candidate division WWE3 bacterium RIFOXYA2_FULL_46_9]|uniref:Uncharacterized protein n=1 Tax=candidate division WWE3 bacterium RIFOXYA2_FULL_46_9 TaxID=1802636 RepID=A0A1F4VZ79_UNCKA|nr:MAG: hypothetical protein A2264_02545 [candidate division WWE3 bacterium RIFOXYA2_FULL_46_9]
MQRVGRRVQENRSGGELWSGQGSSLKDSRNSRTRRARLGKSPSGRQPDEAVRVVVPVAVDVQPTVVPAERDAVAVGRLLFAAEPLARKEALARRDEVGEHRGGREDDGGGFFSG